MQAPSAAAAVPGVDEDVAEPPPVPESAPALRDVTAGSSGWGAPIGAYAVPADADAMLRAFLAEINDVARDNEVVRRARSQ